MTNRNPATEEPPVRKQSDGAATKAAVCIQRSDARECRAAAAAALGETLFQFGRRRFRALYRAFSRFVRSQKALYTR